MIDSAQYYTVHAELDSVQFDTARNLTPRSMILRGISEKFEYLGKKETKNENILTHWPVAQTSSNYEKNWRSKISLDCHFKYRFYNELWISNKES